MKMCKNITVILTLLRGIDRKTVELLQNKQYINKVLITSLLFCK